MMVLIAPGSRMTKKLTHRDGGWHTEGYDEGVQFFNAVEWPVGSFDDLVEVLNELRHMSEALVIRAKLRDGVDPNSVYRRFTHWEQDTNCFEVEPDGVPWCMIDFDKLPCPDWFKPEEKLEFMVAHLPREFHDSSYIYQWSSSEGLEPGAPPRAHLWFYFEQPVRCEVLKGKAVQEKWPCDTAPFNPVQAHYVAEPIFEGAPDPLTIPRFGVVRKASDTVKLTPWVKPLPKPRIVHIKPQPGQNKRLDYWLNEIGNPALHQAVRGTCAFYFSTTENPDEDFITDAIRDRINMSGRSQADIARCLRDLKRLVRSAALKYGK